MFLGIKTTWKNIKNISSITEKLNNDNAFIDILDRTPAYNSTYKKLAVQWLNEVLCFVLSSEVADSFRLRNRQLLLAANRYAAASKKS